MNHEEQSTHTQSTGSATSDRLIDYHMHTAVTVDGKMDESAACERASAAGICEIAFTNHSMLTEPDYTISAQALVEHWDQIQICRKRYPELTVRLGLELDYYAGREQEIAAVVRHYESSMGQPFDFVLGAIHHLNGVFFSNRSHAPALYRAHPTVALYREYFALLTQAVQSKLFDVMAHPDLIKKYTGEYSPRVPFDSYRASAEAFVDALITSQVGIELNTKGLKLPVGEIYPSNDLLALYIFQARARGTEPIITLGSDAHTAKDVGRLLSHATDLLDRMDQTTITTFERRKRMLFALRSRHISLN